MLAHLLVAAALFDDQLYSPDAAWASLKAKTFHGRVRQDTGSGGAWPVSTDRARSTGTTWTASVPARWCCRSAAPTNGTTGAIPTPCG